MTSESDFTAIRIEAEKVSVRGKALFRLKDGTQGYVEELALHYLQKEGWNGLWSENALWWTLMALLFWDVLFAPIEGVWTPEFGSFPSPQQDMPQDLFRPEFYERRVNLVDQRLQNLRSASLTDEVTQSFRQHYGESCRPIEDWDRFSLEEIVRVVNALPRNATLGIIHRLLIDYNENRRGLPDLFLWKEERTAFAEVKGPGDKLSRSQIVWLKMLNELGVETFLVNVEVKGHSKAKRKTATISSEARKRAQVPEGVFWADHIQTLRDDPPARLALARKYMPLPAAFPNAAIALRGLIRDRRKRKLDIENLLFELYHTAAQENFLFGSPYIEEVGEPGFNVADTIPKNVWKNLEMPYSQIGYEKLPLLNKTDKKWITEAWGEPTRHQSAQEYHGEVWGAAVEKYRTKKLREEERTMRWYRLHEKKSSGCLQSLVTWILISILLLIVTSLCF